MEYSVELENSAHDKSKAVVITCSDKVFTAAVLEEATQYLEPFGVADRSDSEGGYAGVTMSFAEDADGVIAKRSTGVVQKAAKVVLDEVPE